MVVAEDGRDVLRCERLVQSFDEGFHASSRWKQGVHGRIHDCQHLFRLVEASYLCEVIEGILAKIRILAEQGQSRRQFWFPKLVERIGWHLHMSASVSPPETTDWRPGIIFEDGKIFTPFVQLTRHVNTTVYFPFRLYESLHAIWFCPYVGSKKEEHIIWERGGAALI